MGNLSVKNVVAAHVVLVQEGALVFAEVVEELEDLVALHDFLQPVVEGIHLQEVEQVALTVEVHLRINRVKTANVLAAATEAAPSRVPRSRSPGLVAGTSPRPCAKSPAPPAAS